LNHADGSRRNLDHLRSAAAGLHRQIQKAFDRIPFAAYETVRKADVRFAVLPSALVPGGDLVRVTVARFDETIPGILFFGPILIQHSAAVIEVIAAHEWAHAYLWCRRAWTLPRTRRGGR
jgi:hypothetical protein